VLSSCTNYFFPFPLGPTKLISDFFDNRQHERIVRCASLFLISANYRDLNAWRMARNDRTAAGARKQELPESQNDRKAGTIIKAGMTGLILVPIYWRKDYSFFE
jgi:hypothetical protein